MKRLNFRLVLGLLLTLHLFACTKDPVTLSPPISEHVISADTTAFVAQSLPGTDPTDDIVGLLYNHATSNSGSISVPDILRGGKFAYRPASAKLFVDNGIVFASKSGGYWERAVGDTVKMVWYGLSTKNPDNAYTIYKCINGAIRLKTPVVVFPFSGTYTVKTSNYWVVPSDFNLQIDGRGATIKVDKFATTLAQETYVMAFKCTEDLNSMNSKFKLKNLNIQAPDILPQWTNTDYYGGHRLVMAIETDGIHTVDVRDCRLNDICGYGIRLKNFVSATVDRVIENNVGGHFPIENGFDSFGDALWLGHYDVETVRSSRKATSAKVTNCVFKGYDTQTNGNFASRCGITVEGFHSRRNDIRMNVDVDNCTISDYDRNLHIEGLSADMVYNNCKLRNFFGIGLVVWSDANVTYHNCIAENVLENNPKVEHYGLGGVMTFEASCNLTLGGGTVFKLNRPVSFRSNITMLNGSAIDFGNSDVFFDHANLNMNAGSSLLNLPAGVSRGYNMYGGAVNLNGATFSAFDKNAKGQLKGENLDAATIKNCKLNNSRLQFNTRSGVVQAD
jgi:hypothetical protein